VSQDKAVVGVLNKILIYVFSRFVPFNPIYVSECLRFHSTDVNEQWRGQSVKSKVSYPRDRPWRPIGL
jgi:hypothetical protein